ncbi:MAG: CinA family protein [Planctomycetales bacterium]|nr:CinA family protein [Planctomycetales bacterium]
MGSRVCEELPRKIHQQNLQAVLALTGGASGAIAALLQTPGASRTILEAVVPYSARALSQWIGSSPEQFCSRTTALAMAMRAYARAADLHNQTAEADLAEIMGVAATASLATDRPKRGAHRLHVAIQTLAATTTWSVNFDKGKRTRGEEETLAADLVLLAIAMGAGIETAAARSELEHRLAAHEVVEFENVQADPAWQQLLAGKQQIAILNGAAPVRAVLPGSFNPVHDGHLAMAAYAEQRLGVPVAWELSIANVDKPALDYMTISHRLESLQRRAPQRSLALTNAATFREKASLLPQTTFVVGADTIERIDAPRYYASVSDRDRAVAHLAAHGCHFLVFGRLQEDRFVTLENLALSSGLRDLCESVNAHEFRQDVSSTALRRAQQAMEEGS